jgi:predicted DNA binding CopG/RHH family protein
MKKKIRYKDEPLEMKRIRDFLPSPDELALKEPTVKVTLSLSRRTVDFFKSSARRHGSRYQKMIRRLLDVYASRFI